MAQSTGIPGLGPGDRLGPYVLDTVLGEGAIGVVFRAAADDGSVVALKILRKELSRDEVYRRRFAREARIASVVRHRHLVPILDLGEARGYHFLAVSTSTAARSVSGSTPRGLSRSTRRSSSRPRWRSAIDALHAQGIVHRDVKPSNVMLDALGNAAVTDFGLAKGPAYTVLTIPGQVMGTLDYIAPELIRGEESGPPATSTRWAAWCTSAFPERRPSATGTSSTVVNAHLEGTPPDLSELRPDVPRALAEVVDGAMAKQPDERPRTGTAFAHLLRAASR